VRLPHSRRLYKGFPSRQPQGSSEISPPPLPRCFLPALSSSSPTPPLLTFFHIGSHNEGLGIISRRPRALLFYHPLIGPTPGSLSIVNTEHDVLERLDDGRELHEVGVYSLSTSQFRSDHFEQRVERPIPRSDLVPLHRTSIHLPWPIQPHFNGCFRTVHPTRGTPEKQQGPNSPYHTTQSFCTISPIRFSPFLRFVSLLYCNIMYHTPIFSSSCQCMYVRL